MSHRIKRFVAFAIFASFYPFAAVDPILARFGHHVDTKLDTKLDTKSVTATTRLSLPDESGFWCPFAPLSEEKNPFRLSGVYESL